MGESAGEKVWLARPARSSRRCQAALQGDRVNPAFYQKARSTEAPAFPRVLLPALALQPTLGGEREGTGEACATGQQASPTEARHPPCSPVHWHTVDSGGHRGTDNHSWPLGVQEWSISPFLTFLNQIHMVVSTRDQRKGKTMSLNPAERRVSHRSVVCIAVHSGRRETDRKAGESWSWRSAPRTMERRENTRLGPRGGSWEAGRQGSWFTRMRTWPLFDAGP